MNKKQTIKKMAGLACLSAVVVVLQLFSNYIAFGPVSITLSLIPIVIGAIIYGPSGGALLGFINGIIVITAPSTLAVFMPFNPFATIAICLIKTTVAGAVSGLLFKLVEKKNMVLATILASIVVPLVNTGLFAIGCMLFFMPLLRDFAGDSNVYGYLFLTFIGINFLIEFATNSILSPTVHYIIRIVFKKVNHK